MSAAERAAQLRQRTLDAFEQAYGGAPSHLARAPGRVNLIGEHTDYNGGFVLPCAIDWHTLVAVRPRADAWVHVVAADEGGQRDAFRLDDAAIPARADQPWTAYVRGMAWALQRAGVGFGGADLAIAGNVPPGAGLSSSAALEVAVGLALTAAHPASTPAPTQLALIAQQAENGFVGCQCGVMDQLISARGEPGHALLIDCRDLGTRAVPLPADVAVLIVHSRVRRGLVDSHYNLRRRQCEDAARHFGVRSLRDLTREALQAGRQGLDDTPWRRARHVVSENARTLAAAEALRAGDLATLGRLMRESHASMRDDFEITVPAIDRLVGIIDRALDGAGGARMTGGGFGGCVVAVLPASRLDAAISAVQQQYRSPDGEPGSIIVTQAAAGAACEEIAVQQ